VETFLRHRPDSLGVRGLKMLDQEFGLPRRVGPQPGDQAVNLLRERIGWLQWNRHDVNRESTLLTMTGGIERKTRRDLPPRFTSPYSAATALPAPGKAVQGSAATRYRAARPQGFGVSASRESRRARGDVGSPARIPSRRSCRHPFPA